MHMKCKSLNIHCEYVPFCREKCGYDSLPLQNSRNICTLQYGWIGNFKYSWAFFVVDFSFCEKLVSYTVWKVSIQFGVGVLCQWRKSIPCTCRTCKKSQSYICICICICVWNPWIMTMTTVIAIETNCNEWKLRNFHMHYALMLRWKFSKRERRREEKGRNKK